MKQLLVLALFLPFIVLTMRDTRERVTQKVRERR